MSVYQTFVSAMNERIRREFSSRNPFHFRHISALKARALCSHYSCITGVLVRRSEQRTTSCAHVRVEHLGLRGPRAVRADGQSRHAPERPLATALRALVHRLAQRRHHHRLLRRGHSRQSSLSFSSHLISSHVLSQNLRQYTKWFIQYHTSTLYSLHSTGLTLNSWR